MRATELEEQVSMTTFPLVKGTRLRATKVDSCGKPIAGPRNRLVTSGFVTLGLTAVMREAQDLTQDNAEGKECVSDRTAPERRWYTPALELCNVNPGLITMFTGWENLLDADDEVIGFRDQKEIESDYGIALEVWTSGKSEDDCGDIPTTDAALLDTSSGRKYGYFLFAGTEWTLGDITIGATVATLTLTGRTIAMPNWGKGPYNVQDDGTGTASRLLVPTSKKEHLTVFRTPIAPPEPTEGSQPVPLATSTVFVDPDFYYGGPAAEPAADVAPEQPAV
ncbi:major tail protein [Mycobacterium phage Serendipitous]|uniref:Major tail protein n=1 Tax=Mycobacterium phage Serendipitous TaxID=2301619 RepID=A0A385UFN8_9CAUD|nr:major tail protein [Mycobacterium phage Serendipitous]AYB70562.1 major tail protein [Mycobacterium phage Serendipitous]